MISRLAVIEEYLSSIDPLAMFSEMQIKSLIVAFCDITQQRNSHFVELILILSPSFFPLRHFFEDTLTRYCN